MEKTAKHRLEFQAETVNILRILVTLILSRNRLKIQDQAGVAELVDARDLKKFIIFLNCCI